MRACKVKDEKNKVDLNILRNTSTLGRVFLNIVIAWGREEKERFCKDFFFPF